MGPSGRVRFLAACHNVVRRLAILAAHSANRRSPAPLVSKSLHALAALALTSVAVLIAGCGGDGADTAEEKAARALAGELDTLYSSKPEEAARAALAADALDASPLSEVGLLSAAVSQPNVKRTIDGGMGRISAVALLRDAVVASGTIAELRTFDPASGRQLGRARVSSPIVRLAAAETLASTVASADRTGAVQLWDLSDLSRPKSKSLGRPTGPIAGLAFNPLGTVLHAVDEDGRLRRFDVVTGEELPSARVPRAALGGDRGPIGALSVAGEVYDRDYALVIASRSGAIARVSPDGGSGRNHLEAGQLTGDVTSVVERTFDDYPFRVGTTVGLYKVNESGTEVVRSETASVRALVEAEGGLLAGTSGGIVMFSGEYDEAQETRPAVSALAASGSESVSGHDDGSLRLIGRLGVGLAAPEGNQSSIAQFGPRDQLLITDGGPRKVEALLAVKPGVVNEDTGGYKVVKSYRPAKSWWPQEEDDDWFVASSIYSDRFVVAGGQDPTGVAVALVWNTRTGKPLVRLPFTTGRVKSEEPDLVTGVTLLDDAKLLVTYSEVQESLVFWSTQTWKRTGTVYVGPISGLTSSPDEKTMVATQQGDEQSGDDKGIPVSRLQFVDVENLKVTRTVRMPRAYDAAFSPDGRSLAIGSLNRVRLWSPDARRPLAPAVDIETSEPGLNWRPDSKLIAVQRDSDVVMLDPATGTTSKTLPLPRNASPFSLSFDSTGRRLAVPNFSGDFDVNPPAIFAVGRQQLRRRACQLAGRNWTRAEWTAQTGGDVGYRPLCPTPKQRRPPAGFNSAVDPVVAYRAAGRIWVGGADGTKRNLGPAPKEDFQAPGFVWSTRGTLAWTSVGRVWAYRDGKVTSWVCPCASVVFNGEDLVGSSSDGRALITMTGSGTRSVRVRGLPKYGAKVLGAYGPTTVVGGTNTPPDRATPTDLVLVRGRRPARRIAQTRYGQLSDIRADSPDGSKVAFVVSGSSGSCYTLQRVGILDIGEGRVTYPTLPTVKADTVLVRSLSWPRSGQLHSTRVLVNCATDSGKPRASRTQLFRLAGDSFLPRSTGATDVTLGGAYVASLAAPPFTFPIRGKLTVKQGTKVILTARGVAVPSVKP